MNLTSILVTAVAYIVVTFPLAIIWHLVLFKKRYTEFGYFEGEPKFK